MKYKNTLGLTALTPVFIVISVFLAGGGHGYYSPAIFMFPTALISFSIANELLMPFIVLGIVQFPVYGLLLDNLQNKRATWFVLITFHLLLVALVFYTTKDVL